MSESGVIPPPEERQPHVVGEMSDVDGTPVVLSINRDGSVRIAIGSFPPGSAGFRAADLDQEEAEEFARLFVSACWEAATMPP